MLADDAWIWFYVPAEAGQAVALTFDGQPFRYHSDQPAIYVGADPLPDDCGGCDGY